MGCNLEGGKEVATRLPKVTLMMNTTSHLCIWQAKSRR